MAYRQDPEALERERERLAQDVRELEGRWTETFWGEVAPGRGLPAPGSLPRASDPEVAVAQLAARLEELRALEQQATKILASWQSAPPLTEEPPPLKRPMMLAPWLSAALEKNFARFSKQVAEAAGETPLFVRGVYGQSRYEGVFIGGHLVTTTAPGAAELVVRNETFSDDLRKLFGSKHDIQLGDDSFDGIFAVEGDEATARQVLDAETRAALVAMGEQRRVAVRAGGGHAGVGLFAINEHGGPDLRWIQNAVTVVRALHHAPARPLRC